jgi:uncharacterized pyridoxal phosphate-containing UPF0001 family protein
MRFHKVVAALSLTLLAAGLALAQAPASTPAKAAEPSVEAQIEQLRKDARAGKADIIASSMGFTAEEAAKFWPLYKGYETAQKAVGDEKVAIIKDYAAHYDAMTDAKATELVGRLQALEDKTLATKHQFVKSLEGVLPAKKVARYYQVENRIQMLTNLSLAADIPLVK